MIENVWILPNSMPTLGDFKCEIVGTKGTQYVDFSTNRAYEKYLDAAISYFNFTVSCRHDLYDFPPGGKLGWGSALLYKITGETKHRETAERIADYFVRTQTPAGHWPDFGEPYSGVAAEFVMWLMGIAQALN